MASSSWLCNRCASSLRSSRPALSSHSARSLHTSVSRSANPLPVTGAGPPPDAPKPSAATASERVARKRAQAELLKQAKEIRSSQQPAGSAPKSGVLKKRFWKDVSVKTQDDGSHTIHLDHRPVRTPSAKSVLPIPPSKPHLATAIALEWDNLTSAQQALKNHLIPLTSMATRAIDLEIQDEEVRQSGSNNLSKSREEIITVMMRYLDTDTLLCWAPEKSGSSIHDEDAPHRTRTDDGAGRESLRQKQVRVAQEIISHLTSTVWPGVVIKPVLESESIFPTPQPEETRAVIRGWISGLGAWELAGLERAVIATKSLCVGTRLLADWAENFRDLSGPANDQQKFGIEHAAEACSLEVSHQTSLWGEVEDTHDVDKEDLRRQLGAVILLVGGTK